MTKVVIFVPGTMGSQLKDLSGKKPELIWPGTTREFFRKFSDAKAEKLRDPNLSVGTMISKFLAVGFYNYIINDLERWGFVEKPAGPALPTLFVCPYDWRKPLQDTTSALERVIRNVKLIHPGNVEITIIGHSQGGLMGRYYLESRKFENSPGFTDVKQLILMGVPNLGLHEMLSLARGDRDHLFLNPKQISRMLNTNGLAFAYLMLPNETAQKTWHNDGDIALEAWNEMYNSGAASRIGLTSQVNLNLAKVFQQSLQRSRKPKGVRYFSFVGTRLKTLSGAVVDTANSHRIPHSLEELRPMDGGDGMVPVWSAWLEGEQAMAVGGKHGSIFRNRAVRKRLAQLLGRASTAFLDELHQTFDFHVDEMVYAPGADIHVRLSFDQVKRSGEVSLEWKMGHLTDDGQFVGFEPFREQEDLAYPGDGSCHWCFNFRAPDKPGIYQLIARTQDMETKEEFFVQDKSQE